MSKNTKEQIHLLEKQLATMKLELQRLEESKKSNRYIDNSDDTNIPSCSMLNTY